MVDKIDIDDDDDLLDDDENLGEVGNPLLRPDDSIIKFSPVFDPNSILDDETSLAFNEDEFDDDFDDDFETEIEGEYELEDDQYGEEFAEVEEAIGMKKPAKRRKRKSKDDDDLELDDE